MWRLWTKGFGVRDWWFWFNDQGWPMWMAWHLPRRAALWAFIRVWAHATDGAPGPEYRRVYAAWECMPSTEQAAAQSEPFSAADAVQALQVASGTYPLQWGGTATYEGAPYNSALGYTAEQRREPRDLDLADPRFDVLWNRLKHLDITGNDIATLLDELDAAPTLGV